MACEKCFILKLNVATIVSYLSSSDFPITEALTLNISNSPARGTPIHAAPSILTHSSIFSLILICFLSSFFSLPSMHPSCLFLIHFLFFLNYFSNVLSVSRVLRKSARNFFFLVANVSRISPRKNVTNET